MPAVPATPDGEWRSRPQYDGTEGAGLAVRMYTSKHMHRLLPGRIAIALAGALGPLVRQRRNPAERRDAERFMKDLLRYTPRADEARGLARRWLAEKSRLRELYWRPWLLERSRVLGREHWDAAHAGGRGVMVVFGHFAGSWALPAILGFNGFDLHVVISAHFWQPLPAGYIRREVLHGWTEYAERPLGVSRLIPSDIDPERLLDLLESGATVGIAFDVPGAAPTPFLGRSVSLSGGAATLAFRTAAKVLPMITERHGARIDLRMLEPLDPADHRDLRSLRAAIARGFEPRVLARPEIVELAYFPSPLVSEGVPSWISSGDQPRSPRSGLP
jgi:lauroyl/myristoyl acyltransferase